MISDKDMDKAWELCGKIGVEEYETIEALYDMAEWKDEQFAKEKQKLIDEACKWLFVNDSYAIPTNVQVDRLREHLNNKLKGE